MVSTTLILLFSALLGTAVLEYVIVRLSHRMALLAQPNERSSHEVPTPGLGGAAIALVLLAFIALKAAKGIEPASELLAGALLLTLVGLWDDLREVSSLLRLFCHVIAVVAVMSSLNLDWPLLVLLAVGFFLVWQVNLFNFMDGIDGIAGVQVLVYCVGVMVLSGGVPGWLGELIWLLAGSILGFLTFNWPPAKIFMGDVGSGLLGLLLGFLTLALATGEIVPLVASLILLMVFWFDASYTLCVRILTGQRFVSAHRSHLYQKLARRYGHRWTTSVFGLYAALWLLPLAMASTMYPDWLPAWLVLAMAPLALACVAMRAGIPGEMAA